MTRQQIVRFLSAVALAGLVTGGLTSCGDDEPSTEEATTEVCDARDDLDDTLAELGRLDPTDRSELADAREEIADDVDELGSAGSELAEQQWDDVQQAWDDLRNTLDDIDGDTDFADAREQLASASDELSSAWDSFVSDVSC
jgi:hypothetical protein